MLAYADVPATTPAPRERLESLLRAKKLDCTLALDPRAALLPPARLAPTGCRALDDALGGGLRRGQLSEIIGPPSSGRSTLVAGALAAATARGEAAALVDAADTFDPHSAAQQGVALDHVLWVRGSGDAARALKACSLVLQAGGFGLVVLDLADIAPMHVRRFPCTTWMRVARMVEGGDTAVVVIGAERIGRSAGGATILLGERPARWRGASGHARLLNPVPPAVRVAAGR